MAINKLPDARDLEFLRTRMATQFQLPSAYDDALSYQGLIYKLIQYLKDTMQNVEDWNVWLEDFVATFDTKLQDTVRDKIQELYDSGKLAELIASVIDVVQDQIDDVNNKIDDQIINVNNTIDDVNNKIDDQIINVNNTIDGVNNKIDTQIGDVNDKIDYQINGVNIRVDNIQEQINDVDNRVKNIFTVDVTDFGAKGDGVSDDTLAIQTAYDSITKGILYFPDGVYNFSTLNIKPKKGIAIVGSGSDRVTLNYTGTETALTFDAFTSGSPIDPFIDNFNLKGFSLKGDNMKIGILAQGIARSVWNDIKVNGSNGADGTIAYEFRGVMLSNFNNIFTSYTDGNVPYRGIFLKAGTRAGVNVGACSNNLFTHVYPEGNSIGLQMSANGGDQNVFLIGSPEACKVYGQVIGPNCRYNTFIGMGYESLNVLSADVNDGGKYSKYINCYSNEKFLIAGKGIKVDGGYFERIELNEASENAEVTDVTVNHWNTGKGGFVNRGKSTRYKNIYDGQAGAYVYQNTPRYALTLAESPFAWVNNNNVPVKMLMYGGRVTQIQFYRGGDLWLEPHPIEGAKSTFIIMPGEKINVSFSVAPVINIIPLNNI